MKQFVLFVLSVLISFCLFAQQSKPTDPLGTPTFLIYSINPSSGSSGTIVKIKGGPFTGATKVSFGGVSAASFTLESDSVINAIVGNGVTGAVYITIPGKILASVNVQFTYMSIASPIITSFSPTSAYKGGVISIKGQNFGGATSISFGGVAVQSFLIVSDTVITAAVGEGATGSIILSNSVGADTISGFTFIPCSTTTSLTTQTVCGSNLPYVWNGQSYTSSGTYSVMLRGTGGCDSMATLSLSVNAPLAPVVNTTINYLKHETASALTATASAGASLLWYTTATGGLGTISAPVPSTDIIGNTTYYVSQKSVNCESPMAAIIVTVTANPATAPLITSFSPTTAGPTDTITINGANFNNLQEVRVGGYLVAILSSTSTTIKVLIGVGILSGSVEVTTAEGTSSLDGFIWNGYPKILSVSPLSAKTGDTVTITGKYLAPGGNFPIDPQVKFGGVAAAYVHAVSYTVVKAVVGNGSSGDVWLESLFGNTTYSGFNYITIPASPVPTITSFFPTSGPVGTAVAISGTNFNTNAINNIVYFGAVKAAVVSATSTLLTVTVPPGSTFEPISVTTNNLTAFSGKPFIVTFSGNNNVFDTTSFSTKINFEATMPLQVELADIDGDGKADILSTSQGLGTVSVSRNISGPDSIAFAPRLTFPAGVYTGHFKTADFDGDGKIDLLGMKDMPEDYGFKVMRNTSTAGSVSFNDPVIYNIAGGLGSFETGDFDLDGKCDIIATVWYDSASAASVYLIKNTSTAVGQISFSPNLQYLGKSKIPDFFMRLGDLNGDGEPELATGDLNSDAISITQNTSIPSAASFDTSKVYSLGGRISDIAIADLDGNGYAELIVAKSSVISIYNTVIIDGKISLGVPKEINLNGMGADKIAVDDFNGDGKLDIAVKSGTKISILQNISESGDINFNPRIDYPTNSPLDPTFRFEFVTGDINNDGKTDIVLGSSYKDFLGVKPGYGIVLKNTIGATPGQACIWTGAVDNKWENAANWTCGKIPDIITDVIINSGIVILSSNTTISSLKIAPNASFTIAPNYNLTVTH